MLKNYQKEALQSLDSFVNLAQSKSNAEAFRAVTSEQYLEIDDSPAPYVCMRVPTGGGKTLIAAKSLRILVNEYLNKQYHLVFWLAPSDKIVTQTLEALKDKRHFYREQIDREFDNVKVLSLKEAYRQKFDPSEELVIIVGTIQSFRSTSKDGRKFFDENGNYYELLKHRDVKPSMENVMKHFKPLIILDEAHKSSTGLSLERLLDLDPAFILELTATPVTNTNKAKKIYASNILYTVNAAALKKESMIKLPIVLKTLDDTRLILQEGIAKRNYLEELAKLEEMHTEKYIRPINLIRAEENRGEDAFTYDRIKQLLLDMGIKEEEIAIQTGNLKEIDGVDLLSRACPIRYIITVDALKEGWDCPFAYVLSVVSSMESKTAIEQLIGRVLRMPYIEEKHKKELGYAYVYVASKNFESVADTIGETLVKNGFEAFEAKVSITRSANSNESVSAIGGLWGEGLFEERQVAIKSEEIDLEILNKESVEPYVNYNSETGKVSIVAMPTASKREVFKTHLKKMLPDAQATELIKAVDALEASNPELLGKVEDFDLPYLAIEDEGYVVPFEESAVLEFISVSEDDIIQNARLTEDEFDIDLIERSVLIDISDNSKIIKERIDVNESLFGTGEIKEELEHKYGSYQGNVVAKKLATSIAKLIRDENEEVLQIYGSDKLNEFIYMAISRLQSERNIPLEALKTKKYHLKRAMLIKLSKLVTDFKIASFDKLLEVSRFSISASHMVTFSSDNYHPNIDGRSHEFKKHKYQYVDKLDSTEEYQVAKYIDGLDGVVTWIKNIVKNPQDSFWLQTAKGKFYPDFIIRLENGKTVVAEYKGEHLKNDDTKRKEEIGNFWASQSEELAFLMLYKGDYKEKLQSLFGKENNSMSKMIANTVDISQAIEGYEKADSETQKKVKELKEKHAIKIQTRS